MITILVEANDQNINGSLTRKRAVAGNLAVANSAIAWHETNKAQIRASVANALFDTLRDGELQNAVTVPNISSAPLGYRLTSAEYATVFNSLDCSRLLAYEIDGSTDMFVPMAQGTNNMLPTLVDAASGYDRVQATRVYDVPSLVNVPRLANVYIRKQGETDLSLARQAVSIDSFRPQSLDAEESYDWQVQSQEAGVTSESSAWQSFSTPVESFIFFNLEWRDTATLTTTQVTGITDLFYDLTGLTASEDYEWRVQETDGTDTSAWSAWIGFTTAAAAVDVDITASVSATLTVAAQSSALIAVSAAVSAVSGLEAASEGTAVLIGRAAVAASFEVTAQVGVVRPTGASVSATSAVSASAQVDEAADSSADFSSTLISSAAATRDAAGTAPTTAALVATAAASVDRGASANVVAQSTVQVSAGAVRPGSAAVATSLTTTASIRALVASDSAADIRVSLVVTAGVAKIVPVSASVTPSITVQAEATADTEGAAQFFAELRLSVSADGGTVVAPGFLYARKVAITPAMSCYNTVVKPS